MCCHVPGKSMNLQSIITAPFFSANFRTSPGFMCECLSLPRPRRWVDRMRGRRNRSGGPTPDQTGLDCVLARLPGADAHDLVHRGHEDLPVTDAAGTCRLGDDVDHLA